MTADIVDNAAEGVAAAGETIVPDSPAETPMGTVVPAETIKDSATITQNTGDAILTKLDEILSILTAPVSPAIDAVAETVDLDTPPVKPVPWYERPVNLRPKSVI